MRCPERIVGLRAAAGAVAGSLLLLVPSPAAAHGFTLIGPRDLWAAWSLDPLVLVPLLAVHWLYGRGLARMWARAGTGHGVSRAQAASFFAGEATLVLALVWPLDALGETLFSAHMAQHMLLMMVAPPLLVYGAPLAPILWALPEGLRRKVGSGLRHGLLTRPLEVLTRPAVAAMVQMAVLWIWHIPGAFEAARFDDLVHTLEHATFLGAALLFWWSVIHSRRRGPMGPAFAGVWTLATMLAGGLLGGVLTFAPRQLYPSYGDSAALWGMDALSDQQLAGLIMWVPAGLIHLAAGVALIGVWLRSLERHRSSA